VTLEGGRIRWVICYGEAPANADADRPVGSRLWLYTNFDCNLRCDYCCVRSSPKAPRYAVPSTGKTSISGDWQRFSIARDTRRE
jgi:hypothetical protein